MVYFFYLSLIQAEVRRDCDNNSNNRFEIAIYTNILQFRSNIILGFNVETVEYKNISFTVWDVGGQDKIR